MRRFLVLIALLAIALCASTEQAQAQFFGGYGAGFTPSPQAVYSPYNGAVIGVVPPPPIYYGGMAYGGMGYGGYGGYGYGGGYRPMPLGQAIATAAVITAINNRGYGGYGGYGYRPYTGYGFRGGYGGFRHHHRH